MPYRRRKYKSKSAYGIAKKALKKVNKITKGIEHKHISTTITVANIDDDGAYTANLNVPAQGLLDSNRIGDSILCNRVHLRLTAVTGSNDNSTQLRMILIWDKYDTIENVGDILISVGDSNAPNSHYNVDTRKNWIKLMDKNIILQSPSGSKMKYLNKVFKLNKLTQFNAASTSPNKGALVLLYISNIDSGGSDADKPNVVGTARLFFTDS